MAQATTTILVNGETSLVRVDLLSDGSGELTNFVVLKPSDLLNTATNTQPMFRIMQIWYSMVWFDVTVGVGTLQPSPLWTLARDTAHNYDFRSFGGLVDYAQTPAIDENGELWISTNGFTTAGSIGNIILELRKTYISTPK